MKAFFILFFAFIFIYAEDQVFSIKGDSIVINNKVLTKVNNTSISTIDIVKKMDLLLYQFYPNLTSNIEAKYQFYTTHYENTLNDMINMELMLKDAENKHISINNTDLQEELQARFGPNIAKNLKKIDMKYEEVCKLLKKELIIEKMKWYFITSKAIQSITPQKIKKAYLTYLQKEPLSEKFNYQIISLNINDQQLIDELYKKILTKNESLSLEEFVKDMKQTYSDKIETNQINISPAYILDNTTISISHRNILKDLNSNSFSLPIVQFSRNTNTDVSRIFYLKDHIKGKVKPFNEMEKSLKEELIKQQMEENAQQYFSYLQKKYAFKEYD